MKVFQTDLLLDKVVIFRGQVRNEILNGDTGVSFSLTFQFLQLFVRCTDIESVENSPVEVKPDVDGLVIDPIVFCNLSGGTGLTFNIIQVPVYPAEKSNVGKYPAFPNVALFLLICSSLWTMRNE